MEIQEKVQKDIWEMIKKSVPQPVIFIILIYIVVMIGGSKIYTTITANMEVTSEKNVIYLNILIGCFFVLTAVAVVACIVIYIINYRKNKNAISGKSQTSEISKTSETPEMPKGKIEAYIVEQDEMSRDNKFNEINKNAKKTYWVLGVSLTSVVNHEPTLNKMAKKKTDIRLCMMNPDIAIDNLCTTSIEKKACIGLLEEVRNGNIKLENIKEKMASVNDCDNLLEIYHVLINVIHFNDYYATATNYKETIKNSRDNLLSIKQNIDGKYGEGYFNLRFADSFMPMSLTISDAYEKDGHMIVEFHLPFTQHKVLFELFRDTNEELFEVFVAFYENIWDRAKRANNE